MLMQRGLEIRKLAPNHWRNGATAAMHRGPDAIRDLGRKGGGAGMGWGGGWGGQLSGILTDFGQQNSSGHFSPIEWLIWEEEMIIYPITCHSRGLGVLGHGARQKTKDDFKMTEIDFFFFFFFSQLTVDVILGVVGGSPEKSNRINLPTSPHRDQR